MRRARAFHLLVIAGLLALSTTALAQRLDLEGQIVHGVTGEPIAGAVVEVSRSFYCGILHGHTRDLDSRETLTDARGRYRFSVDWRWPPCLFVQEEERTVSILAPGYRVRYMGNKDWSASGGRVRLYPLTSRSQLFDLKLESSPYSSIRRGPLWRAAAAESFRVGPPSPRPPGMFVTLPGAILDQLVTFAPHSRSPTVGPLVMARDARTGTLHAWRAQDGAPVPLPLEGGGWTILGRASRLGIPLLARGNELHLPTELPRASRLGGLDSPAWTDVPIGPGPPLVAALTPRVVVAVSGVGDRLTFVSLAEDSGSYLAPHRLVWTPLTSRALGQVMPVSGGVLKCLASEGDFIIGLVANESGVRLVRLSRGLDTVEMGHGPLLLVPPGLLSGDVTACAVHRGRLHVATSDGAVIALATDEYTAPRLAEGFQFRMPGPPRPVVALGFGWIERLFAVTGDEHVYFFTADGALDERIDAPTAADLQPRP